MTTISTRERTTNRFAAWSGSVTGGIFLLLLAIMHLLRPDLDPSWRVVSEYEIGPYGWVMQAAFVTLAISTVAAALSVRRAAPGGTGSAAVGLLGLAAAGMLLGGLAVSDPITATPEQVTTHGSLHGLGALLAIPTFPIAAGLATRALTRSSGWSGSTGALRTATVGTWVGLGQMLLVMVVLLPANGGSFGPEVPLGWSNRLMIVTYAAWLLVLGPSTESSHQVREHVSPEPGVPDTGGPADRGPVRPKTVP